jgi:hypothetical protein
MQQARQALTSFFAFGFFVLGAVAFLTAPLGGMLALNGVDLKISGTK